MCSPVKAVCTIASISATLSLSHATQTYSLKLIEDCPSQLVRSRNFLVETGFNGPAGRGCDDCLSSSANGENMRSNVKSRAISPISCTSRGEQRCMRMVVAGQQYIARGVRQIDNPSLGISPFPPSVSTPTHTHARTHARKHTHTENAIVVTVIVPLT